MNPYEHRKSTCALTVLDRQGLPVKGVRMKARQTTHEFLFGCGAFDLVYLLDANTPDAERPRLESVWEAWRELFNYGTLPFYQGRYEPAPGLTEEAVTLRAARALAERGYAVKGHPLCWHSGSAMWLMDRSAEEVFENQKARIRREIGAFHNQIKFWDVINEVVIMPEFTHDENAITPLCQKMGRVPLVKALFDVAREADPDATLLINDFILSERYRQLVQDCLAAGVPIGAIGLQSHQHQGAWGRDKLLRIIERFEGFGLPLHFTENTFVSGDLMPPHIVDLNDFKVEAWPSTPQGEDRQARDLLEMLDTLFEHPAVTAFTTWSMIDGGWLKAPAGLLRADASRKPAFEAYKQRVQNDWRTDAELVTDERGACVLTGFRGDYELSCDQGTFAFTLDKNLDSLTATLQ